MSYGNARSGLNNVGEYQASGLPWVTSSGVTSTPFEINFPYVTNGISLHVTGGSVDLRLGFSLNGVNGTNYITLKSSDSWLTLNIRCKAIWLRAEAGAVNVPFSVMAGLTTIEEREFPILTGSAIYNSASNFSPVFGYGKPLTPGSGSGIG